MPGASNPLIVLIERLADLVPEEKEARRIVGVAELESGLIAFDARALVNWWSIVGEAWRRGKIDDLVRAAAREYQAAADLVALLDEYRRWAAEHGTAAQERLFVSYAAEEHAMGRRASGVASPGTWESLLARAERLTRRFLAGHEGTPTTRGTFDPDLYVRREHAERALERFLAGQASALILLGDSGVGKTTLLCRWVADLLESGHAVLAYDCAALAQADVQEEVLRDLAMPPDLAPAAALEAIGREAAGARRNLVVVFDSIGDYRGTERNGMQVLLRQINALVMRSDANVRIVFSCNAATWSRMERVAPMPLDPDRYFRPAEGEPFLRVEPFTPEELETAYRRYREVFDLFSPFETISPPLRERLRDPVLLRMTAETYRGVEQPLRAVSLGVGIYRRFLHERVRTDRERWLVDALAEAMVTRQTSALPIPELARDDELGPEVLAEDADSTYSRLLDCGVLVEWRGSVRAGAVIKFAHSRLAAYAIAEHLLAGKPDVAGRAAELIAGDAEFPLAWEVARTLLLVSADEGAISALAASPDLERRELATEALVELHADRPEIASRLLDSLLEQPSEEARRTALKAAYNIGPPARDFFLRAAIEGDPSIRESVKNTLYLVWRNESAAGRRSVAETVYLIWRHAPGFTHEFLNTLLDALVLKNLTRFPAILEFVLDLTITIYINHCEEEEVIQQTAARLHDLATARLHLHLFNTGMLGPKFEKLVFGAVARVFGDQILKWMLFADKVPVESFFDLPAERRASLERIADAFDPSFDLDASRDDLVAMLQSGTPIFSGSAAVAIAVHAVHDFAAAEPIVRRLWDEVNAEGRLWILLSFAVLLKDTPPEWTALLEDLTRSWIESHRDEFLGPSSRIAGDLDIVLLPMGLAYGKSAAPMTLFHDLVSEGLAAGDAPLVARCIAGLGPVGFYHPGRVFDALAPAMRTLDDEQIAGAIVTALATIRTLHFDAVDRFLDREGAPEDLRRRVDAAADVDLVRRLIRVLGYYNNAVHFSVYYPRMREPLSAGALRLLARARDPGAFVTDYTLTAMRMLRESNFQVLEWTRPA